MTTQDEALKIRHAYENIRNNYVGWRDNDNFKVLEKALAALATVSDAQPVDRKTSDKWSTLFVAASNLIAHTNPVHGYITFGKNTIQPLTDALHDIDGGKVSKRAAELHEKAFMPLDQATALALREHVDAPAPDVRPSPDLEGHRVMTREEYDALKLKGWHQVCHGMDSAGSTAIRYGSPDVRPYALSDEQIKKLRVVAYLQESNIEMMTQYSTPLVRLEDVKALASQPAAPSVSADAQPIDMILHCPKCGLQHIDAPEWERDPHDMEQGQIQKWKNPPHRSHLCRPEDGGCGHIWRPADVPTNGVASIKTKGKADSPAPDVRPSVPVSDEQIIDALAAARIGWSDPDNPDGPVVKFYNDGDCDYEIRIAQAVLTAFNGQPAAPVQQEPVAAQPQTQCRYPLCQSEAEQDRIAAEVHAALYSGEVQDKPQEAGQTRDWMPMETAPKDGTMLRLLVQFDDHATEDSAEPCPTIGANSFAHSREDVWQFAGWNWEQDCFDEGVGTPVGWLPLLDVQAAPAVPQGRLMGREPTDAMQAAGAQAIRFDTTVLNKMWTANSVFRAMWDAALSAPAKKGGE